jgi:hypothetical protein
MKKSDLRTGMMIETRNGKKALVMLGCDDGDNLVCVDMNDDSTTYCPLRFYNENLKISAMNCTEDDIVKVYRSLPNCEMVSFKQTSKDLIWERKEFVEITMDQIAEKFGIPVEQLKIKKG